MLGYLIPDIKSGEPLYQIAGTDVYLVTIIIGSVASLLLFALNMRGLAAAATVQKVLCFILVGAAIIGRGGRSHRRRREKLAAHLRCL